MNNNKTFEDLRKEMFDLTNNVKVYNKMPDESEADEEARDEYKAENISECYALDTSITKTVLLAGGGPTEWIDFIFNGDKAIPNNLVSATVYFSWGGHKSEYTLLSDECELLADYYNVYEN